MNVAVTAQSIRAYAESIHAPLLRWKGLLVAPATMPILFWRLFDEPLLAQGTILHGSQQFMYHEPIVEGMQLQCELSLIHVEEKIGRQGRLTFYTYKLVCYEARRVIVRAVTTLIKVGETT